MPPPKKPAPKTVPYPQIHTHTHTIPCTDYGVKSSFFIWETNYFQKKSKNGRTKGKHGCSVDMRTHIMT